MTTPTPRELDDELYDLLLIGYLYWQRANPAAVRIPAWPILGGLWRSDCYRPLLNRKLSTRDGLRDRVQLNSKVVRAAARTRATPAFMGLEGEGSTMHFVMLQRPTRRLRNMLVYDRIIGMAGYPLHLTATGAIAATAAQQRYTELTEKAFLAGCSRFQTLGRYEKEGL